MTRSVGYCRWKVRSFVWLVCALLLPLGLASAEKVADLPAPTGYVNDFGGVLSPDGKAQIAAVCGELERKTGAQIAVVTIKTLDDDETVEDFTVALEEKWKVGKKGKDNGLLILVVLNPKKLRTETGYGLEGVLPDSVVGRVQEQMVPLLHAGNYDGGLLLGVQDYANLIAKDAGVTLDVPAAGQGAPGYHTFRRVPAERGHLGIGGIIGGVILIGLLILMIATGNGGWIWVLLMMLMNGGGRGGGGGGGWGGGGGDDSGGGFGGFGGGSSGGGGASSDY